MLSEVALGGLLLSVTGALLVVYLYREAKNDLFSPTVAGGVVLLVFYVFDGIFAVWDSLERSGFWLSGKYFAYTGENLLVVSAIISASALVWVLGSALGTAVLSSGASNSGYSARLKRCRSVSTITQLLLLFVSFGLISASGIALYRRISELGGVLFYLSNIGHRAIFFANQTLVYAFITMSVIFSSISMAVIFSVADGKKRGLVRFIAVMVFPLVFLLSLATGARASVARILFILGFHQHHFVRKWLPTPRLLLVLLVFGILSVLYVYQTRSVGDASYYTGPLDRIFNTVEISQANNLIIILSEKIEGTCQGYTLVTSLLAPVPRAILQYIGFEKAKGGNPFFTAEIWPDRWERTKSEVSLGFLGEVVLNFGIYVVPLAVFLASFGYRIVYGLLVRWQVLGNSGIVLGAGVSWSAFQLLRSDLFNTMNGFALYLASWLVYVVIVVIGSIVPACKET